MLCEKRRITSFLLSFVRFNYLRQRYFVFRYINVYLLYFSIGGPPNARYISGQRRYQLSQAPRRGGGHGPLHDGGGGLRQPGGLRQRPGRRNDHSAAPGGAVPPLRPRRPHPLYSHLRQHHGAEHGPPGLAAARGPLPGQRGGAQRRHAAPPGSGGGGGELRPHPLRQRRAAGRRGCGGDDPSQHPPAGHGPRLQCQRRGPGRPGGGGRLPPAGGSLCPGRRPDRGPLAHRL